MVHGSSGTKAGDGVWKGTSRAVSALAKEEDCSTSEGTVGQVGITLAVLGRRALQKLQVKASRRCLGKLDGPGGWTLHRREAQGSTQIIECCRKRL